MTKYVLFICAGVYIETSSSLLGSRINGTVQIYHILYDTFELYTYTYVSLINEKYYN